MVGCSALPAGAHHLLSVNTVRLEVHADMEHAAASGRGGCAEYLLLGMHAGDNITSGTFNQLILTHRCIQICYCKWWIC